MEQYQTEAHYEWHVIELEKPDWKDDSHAIAHTLHTASLKRLIYVAVNALWGPLSFEYCLEAGWLAHSAGGVWWTHRSLLPTTLLTLVLVLRSRAPGISSTRDRS